MSKYYKFISQNNIEEYKKPYVYVDGLQISYPSKEVLLMAEIKPLVIEDIPEHNEETQYIQPYYVDGETEITKTWRVCDVPFVEEVIEDEPEDA